jgi:hypothetical protein
MEKKWIAIIAILLIMCTCVVMSVPLVKVSYTVTEPYSATEKYFEPQENTILQEVICFDDARQYGRSFSADLSGDCDILFELSSTNPIDFAVDADDECGYLQVSSGLKVSHNSKGSKFTIDKNSYSTELCLNIMIHKASDVTIKVQELYSLPKQRTVTKYQDVTKYKHINMFEYITQ